jgi:hypothetical protein
VRGGGRRPQGLRRAFPFLLRQPGGQAHDLTRGFAPLARARFAFIGRRSAHPQRARRRFGVPSSGMRVLCQPPGTRAPTRHDRRPEEIPRAALGHCRVRSGGRTGDETRRSWCSSSAASQDDSIGHTLTPYGMRRCACSEQHEGTRWHTRGKEKGRDNGLSRPRMR